MHVEHGHLNNSITFVIKLGAGMFFRRFVGVFFCCLGFGCWLFSQGTDIDIKAEFRIHALPTEIPISIDGKLDEAAWQKADVGTNFWQKLPYFSEETDPKTEVRLCYDSDYLYISAKCFQTEDLIIQSLKRDEFWDNDGIGVLLDPLNTKTNAFLFGISAVGVQWDAQRSQTADDVNTDWSNRWYSAVDRTDEYWSMEMAIPFKILRYKSGTKEWGLNFVRNLIFKNEYHNWTAVPESFWPIDPAFAGTLTWEEAPEVKRSNYNLIPFVTSGVRKEVESDATFEYSAGLDARMALTSSINMDVTLNPDFSQIEVDELVTNLTRFNIFLPEKRSFFLENSDVFGDFGFSLARPFFSRTIGLDEDGNRVPILYGIRVTGDINQSIRGGFMNLHSLSNGTEYGQNQTAISAQKRFGRSYIQGMFLNRQAFDGAQAVEGDYGRNFSLENAYISDNGKYSAWLGLHRAFKKGYSSKTGFYNSGFSYTDPSWAIVQDFVIMQENYYTDMGYVVRIENYDAERDTSIRVGFNHSFTSISYKIRPTSGMINLHEFSFENYMVANSDWTFNEWQNEFRYQINSRQAHNFSGGVKRFSTELLYPFSFTEDFTPLPAGRYNYANVQLRYQSDSRKRLSINLTGESGGFYNGTIRRMEAGINYRVQPWGNLGVEYQWNKLDFPQPYGNAQINALVSKLEIGFSKNLLWANLFQFVAQSEFLGINSRLQWRFSPMSDIFLVYVDNYDVYGGLSTRDFQSNNRAILFKVNYWY